MTETLAELKQLEVQEHSAASSESGVVVEVPDKIETGNESDSDDEAPKVPRGSVLEYVHVEYIPNRNGNWVTKRVEDPLEGDDDEFGGYSFVLLKEWEWDRTTFTNWVEIKSDVLRDELRQAMGEIEGISWREFPLRIEPQMLLTFYDHIVSHHSKLLAEGKEDAAKHVKLLLNYFETEHRRTLATVKNLIAHKEITFDHLWAILIPRTVLFITCPITRLPRAVRLLVATKEKNMLGMKYWSLNCECTDLAPGSKDEAPFFGQASFDYDIPFFKGRIPITSLRVVPLPFHPNAEGLSEELVARGKRWASFEGRFHKQYDDTAYAYNPCNARWLKVTVGSRIMVDKQTYVAQMPNIPLPEVNAFGSTSNDQDPEEVDATALEAATVEKPLTAEDLTREQLLLATPLLYGFSLSDKMWVAFKVDSVKDINWQDDAFSNLVLPAAQKSLIQALVQSHSSVDEDNSFDDFIQGKGKGLIINLFGPPGVGKTLSAEATSEHVRKPLYVVGVGELGSNVEDRLKTIFDVAAIWQAIVLIDEADVFMEQRSVHDLERNALVAVFLRQLEYYRGILFLTTNRVKVFDEAFQSRIHISLHYQDLTPEAKRQIWTAFFLKAGLDIKALTENQWDNLSHAKVNGRQIKNAVRSCQGLANSRKEVMSFKHVQEVLGVMKQFENDLKTLKEHNDLM